MVFSPKMQTMFCPYCDGTDCENKAGDTSLTVCASCGGEINVSEVTSASKCPYCGNYLIFDERVSGRFKPDTIIPFKIGKDNAVERMEMEFKKRIFAPVSFLSEKSLVDMEGYYVPFFLYDYKADSEYIGQGTRVRTWRSGDYDYTETSYYDVARKMEVLYDNIPVDASNEMDDKTMDLLEPFDYKGLMEFDPKYLSGFFGEIYNAGAEVYEDRAKKKAVDSASSLLHGSLNGYSTLRADVDRTTLTGRDVDFALFPVWLYKYKWMGREFKFFVNGQTGKVIGKTPISKLKVLLYGTTWAGCIVLITWMILSLSEVL